MDTLVTGFSGFVGHYFMQYPGCVPNKDQRGEILLHDKVRLRACIKKVKPEAVVHLAAQSHVPTSFANPKETYEVNFLGTLSLLETLAKENFTGRFLFIGSGDMYGKIQAKQLPIIETMPLTPRNPYAVSKVAAEALCYQWSQTSPIEIVIARSFNHCGPGQSANFVISSFAKQIVEIKLGLRENYIEVGDIEISRDFTDVRDIVAAYFLLLAKGCSGEAYNVCSGQGRKLKNILEDMREISGIDFDVRQNLKTFRLAEQKTVFGSHEKLTKATRWRPNIEWKQTLKDILSYWEKQLA
jgi:GDP-4-dehydro-6-deoxy-D-mannose reductase